MTDPDHTLAHHVFSQANGRAGMLLGLTVLWHPDPARIGEQTIGPPGEGGVEVGRYTPLFFRPGSEGIALGHRAIARSPLRLRRTGDDSVEITPPDSAMAVEVDGTLLTGVCTLDRAAVARGVVLGLGGHVLLCMHWMTSFPRANELPGLLGVGSAAIATRELIRQVAPTDLPVLLLGETGTGKDVAARAIHACGKRRERPLVAVNMATLSDSLAAADLFGAVKGAYTGALASRQGLFAEAGDGTLFLDEMGDTPQAVQPMLLRVLECGSYRPLGASVDAQSRARLIAATDQDLDSNGFNQALLRRMEVFVIRVPPLRERREDIGVLLLHALRNCAASSEEVAAFPPALVNEMCNYDWPGNVRQLANVTRRALMALRAGTAPMLAQFVQGPVPASAAAWPVPPAASGAPAAPRRRLTAIGTDDLLQALDDNAWQISGAAQQLDISRPSLYKLIESHPAIRAAGTIPVDELSAVARDCGGDVGLCAARLKTPAEALRRHLRQLGLERSA